jgi:hypothetical protein
MMDNQAQREREAVVAWLRGDADITEVEARQIAPNVTGNPRRIAAEWALLVSIKRGIANAIEAGDHLDTKGNTNGEG